MSARHNVVAQAELSGLDGVDYLTRQYQLARALFTDHARQQHGSDGRKDAQLYLGLAKTRAIGCDDDIASSDEFTAATECRAVDESNGRLSYLFQLSKDSVERIEHLEDRFLDVLLDRDTRAERTTTLVRIKDNCHQLALRTLSERTRDLTHHRDVEYVQRRPCERDPPDAIIDAETNMLVRGGHLCNLWLKLPQPISIDLFLQRRRRRHRYDA